MEVKQRAGVVYLDGAAPITRSSFAEFNERCHAERLEKAERFFAWAQDPNNTPEQCAYWTRKSLRLAGSLDHFREPTLINKTMRFLRKLIGK